MTTVRMLVCGCKKEVDSVYSLCYNKLCMLLGPAVRGGIIRTNFFK